MINRMSQAARSLTTPLAAATVCSAAIFFITPSPASAQYGGAAGFTEVMSPHYLRRDLRIFENALQLDPSQAAILQSLFWDYEARHEASRQRMMERIESLKDDLSNMDRTQQIRMIFDPFITQANEWEQQRSQFLQDVQYLLNEQQQQEWPSFLMKLRREKELPKGELAGERTDLIVHFGQLNLPQTATVTFEPVLNAYAIELDAALQTRDRDISESRITMMSSMRDEDPQTSLRLYRRQLDLRQAVRNVNDRYIDIISADLPEEFGSRFRTDALESGYPRIYRASPSQRLIDAALRLTEVGEATATALRDLHRAFHQELTEINDQLLRTLRNFEPKDALRRAELAATAHPTGPEGSQPTRDETQAMFAGREDMSRRYVNQLQDLLGDDIFLTLPGAQRYFRSLNNTPTQVPVGTEAPQRRPGGPRHKQVAPRGDGTGTGPN